MTGTIKATIKETFTASRDATATLEGFDPSNGRTIWTFDAGRSVGLITEQVQAPQPASGHIVLRAPGGGYVDLDLRTGARRAVARTVAAWCRGAVTYSQAVPYRTPAQPLTMFVGEASLFPCDATGSRAAIPAHLPSFVAANSTADGVVAWSDSTGVVAAPLS